jgi:hypothetical protein
MFKIDLREMSDIKTQLTQELADIEWRDLKPHAMRDGLVVVHENLNLLDVGVAIAKDDVISVQHWISEQLIIKPSPEQLSSWNKAPERQFTALIVQPFVLIQEKSLVS